MFTELRRVKAAFDPHNKMNPEQNLYTVKQRCRTCESHGYETWLLRPSD
ncbi:hypothetical protein PWW31_12995 [Vibrio harveyi]|nr:hypothetical protein PWW31_12995 [Vibrio harveyi]